MLLVNLEVNGVDYSVCNIYCPNDMSERIKFLQNMKFFVQNHAVAKNNIFTSNCVESPLDRASRKLDRRSTVLAEIKNDQKLIDVWRSFNPDPDPDLIQIKMSLLILIHQSMLDIVTFIFG